MQEREGKQEATVPFRTWSEVTHHHFCLILFAGSESLSPAHTQGDGNSSPPLEGRSIKGCVKLF